MPTAVTSWYGMQFPRYSAAINQSDRHKERKPPKDRTSSSEHVVEQDTSVLVKLMFLIILMSDQMIVLL